MDGQQCGLRKRPRIYFTLACSLFVVTVRCSPIENEIRSAADPSKKLDGKFALYVPELEDLARDIKDTLSNNFEQVKVKIVDCPDLTADPFRIASTGLSGSTRIVDVGGNGNFYPVIRKQIYKLSTICETAELPQCLAIGAGAGPLHLLGYNSDYVHNVLVPSVKSSYAMRNTPPDGEVRKPYRVIHLTNETANEFVVMANLLLSEGKPGKVIKVEASKRSGSQNFVTQMRIGLTQKYGNRTVGLGGIVLINSGKIKMHVMPDKLPEEPFPSKAAMEKWATALFDMDAPLTCATIFLTKDPGLDLRLEHTHCFSDHGDGGHYHYDLSPESVQYEAYLTPAQLLYRIDRVPY